jgi:hypothetical protein
VSGERRTVWILGSGFSRPLGGPLLVELLSPPSNNFVQALYKDNSYIGPPRPNGDAASDELERARQAAEKVRVVYATCGGSTAAVGRRFWSDAEAFLDQLDAAAEGNPETPAASRMRRAISMAVGEAWPLVTIDDMRSAARKLVAAECCAFLKDPNLAEERWQPYVSWAGEAKPTDAIVTFNYDRVLELLDSFGVVDPATGIEHAGKPNVFKMHGSVDWQEQPGLKPRKYMMHPDPENALNCPGFMIGLATPGPTKKIATESLAKIWTPGCDKIRSAEVVVFVGYRFPKSDAEARERILGAISGNSEPHVRLHVVLGPERNPDVVRLQELLRYAMNKRGRSEVSARGMTRLPTGLTYEVTIHALWAEDFFTVWNRDLLWPKSLLLG